MRIGIHCALEAENYERAFQYAEAYLLLNQTDQTILGIFDRLSKQDRVEELKLLFASG